MPKLTPSPQRAPRWRLGLSLWIGLLGLLTAAPATANDSTPESKRDFARLPAYCSARLGRTGEADYQRWEAVIGPNFIHIHHYCFALHKRLTARAKVDPIQRRYWLNSTMVEFDYVEQHAEGPLLLFPEMFTERGRIYLELEDVASAARYFARAIKTDPTYGRAYAAMADLYLQQGQRDKARQLVEQGLAADPDSRSLKKRLARLKSAKAKPTPAEPQASPDAPDAPEAAGASEGGPTSANQPSEDPGVNPTPRSTASTQPVPATDAAAAPTRDASDVAADSAH